MIYFIWRLFIFSVLISNLYFPCFCPQFHPKFLLKILFRWKLASTHFPFDDVTTCFSNVSTLNINSLTNHKSLYYQIHFMHPWMYNRNEKYKKTECLYFSQTERTPTLLLASPISLRFLALLFSRFLFLRICEHYQVPNLGCRRKRRCPVWGGASFLWQTTILSSYRSIPRPF